MNPLNWILLGIAAGLAGGLVAREVQRAREGAPPPLPLIPPPAGQAPPPVFGTLPGPDRTPARPAEGGMAQPQQPSGEPQPEVRSTAPRIMPAVGDVIDVSKGRPIIDDEADDALVLGRLQELGWTGEIIGRRVEQYDRHIRVIALRTGQGDMPVFWDGGMKVNRLGKGEAPVADVNLTPGILVRPGYGSGKLVTDAGVNDILEVSVPESAADDVNAQIIMDQLRAVGWMAQVLGVVRQDFRPGFKIVRVMLRAGAGDIPVDWAEGRSVVNLVRGAGPQPPPIGPGLPQPTTNVGPNE